VKISQKRNHWLGGTDSSLAPSPSDGADHRVWLPCPLAVPVVLPGLGLLCKKKKKKNSGSKAPPQYRLGSYWPSLEGGFYRMGGG
jgi:hypothetical protein